MKRNALVLLALSMLLLVNPSARAQSGDDEEVSKIEIGAHVTGFGLNLGFETDVEPGFGGRLTYNLNNSFALEAEGNFFPRDRFRDLRASGRAFQGFFGVKAGKRYKTFGIFAKARPGFMSFSEGRFELVPNGAVFDPSLPLEFRRSRLTHFVTDVGVVVEFYPSRRVFARIDAGDTIIRYGKLTVNSPLANPGEPFVLVPFTFPAETTHNPQVTAGVGFRF